MSGQEGNFGEHCRLRFRPRETRSHKRWVAEPELRVRSLTWKFTTALNQTAWEFYLWFGGEVGPECQRCERQRKDAWGMVRNGAATVRCYWRQGSTRN